MPTPTSATSQPNPRPARAQQKKKPQNKNQLLISRFFRSSSSAKRPQPKSPKPSAKPITESPPHTPPTSPPSQPPSRQPTSQHAEPHPPASLASPAVPTTRSSARNSRAAARAARPIHRLFVDVDADDESEVERDEQPPLKRFRTANLDLNLSDAESEAPDQSVRELDNTEASEHLDDDPEASASSNVEEPDGEEPDVVEPSVSRPPTTTLGSYTSSRADPGILKRPPPPRDPARRKRFSEKIGRLESNPFFLRRTGGAGLPADDNTTAAEDVAASSSSTQSNKRKGKAINYTPLESQYVKLREKHPDMLLLVECGYKYRMFDTDAATAAKVLRVAAFFDHNFLTAGFPTHRLAHHVSRLVDAGHKVGVISQSETAALKKASDKSSRLFERCLSAVYTKGTIAADGKLAASPASTTAALAKSSAYIMAVCELPQEIQPTAGDTRAISLAAVDSASGDVFFDAFIDDVLRSDLDARLVSIEPVEMLTPSTLLSLPTDRAVRSFCDSSAARLERLADEHFSPNPAAESARAAVERSGGILRGGSDAVLACLGALAVYLKQFGLELSMSRVADYKSFRTTRQMNVGADVLRNFEVFGNSNNGAVNGSLIGLLGRTRTAFGARQMRQWVSHPLVCPHDIAARLDAVEYLRDFTYVHDALNREDDVDTAVAELVQSFSKLPDLEQGLTRISCRKCTPAELVRVLSAIDGVGRKIDRIKSLDPSASFPSLLKKIFSNAPSVGQLLESKIVEVLNRANAAEDKYAESFAHDDDTTPAADVLKGVESAEAFLTVLSELNEANSEVTTSNKSMMKLLKKLREQHSFPQWEWKKVANEEYLLEVPVKRSSKMPSSWVIVNQTKAVKRFRPAEASRGHERVLCARETQENVALRCWQVYLKLFSTIASQLRSVVRLLVDLDCLSALAQVATLPGYCKPSIEVDETIPSGLQATDARHPLTELLPTCTTYVPNDISVGRIDDARAVVISGPNYGGKSSYARMTALLVMMAQIGSFVPAKSARLRPFDAVHARMGSSDSIAKGMSSLMVELAETSRILATGTSRSLVVLDELGRGTSTHDGAAIAYATLKHLVKETKCMTLFVTHYPMLATLRIELPKLVKACFMNYLEKKNEDKTSITFLYKIADGVASSSYGLNVARLAGISSSILDSARQNASEMEERLLTARREAAWSRLLRPEAWSSTATIGETLRFAEKSV